MSKKSRAGRWGSIAQVQHATEPERKARFFGLESRQVLRNAMRSKFGHGPGLERYRALMGLPELKDRESFKPHLHVSKNEKETP